MGSIPTNNFQPLNSDSFSEESKAVIDFIADYYKNIETYPVRSNIKPGYLLTTLPKTAPLSPEPLEDILKDVTDSIIPGLTHWQSPNFFAYFQANASNAGFLGDMLCSGFNVVGFNWMASPAATELEQIVMDWMGKMLKLPTSFLFSGNGGGVLHGSTCEALVCTLAAARDRVLEKIGWDKMTKLVVYATDQTHFSLQKASKLIGVPSSNFRSLPTSFSTGFSLSSDVLHAAIEDDIKAGLVPMFLCASIGTTACGAVDPVKVLGKIANDHKLWYHIDAAYAGSACICPEFRHYLDGVEYADSVSLNAHKWFLTNMECCCLWLKAPKLLIDSLSTDPEILKYKSADQVEKLVDYKDWQIALSRRFKAIKLWVVIRRHGLANLMYHIRSDVNLARYFEQLVHRDSRFEIVVQRHFALVCFRLKVEDGKQGWEKNQKLLNSVNSSGRAFMTHGVASGIYFIRCAIGSTLTEARHVEELWKLVQEKAEMLSRNGST